MTHVHDTNSTGGPRRASPQTGASWGGEKRPGVSRQAGEADSPRTPLSVASPSPSASASAAARSASTITYATLMVSTTSAYSDVSRERNGVIPPRRQRNPNSRNTAQEGKERRSIHRKEKKKNHVLFRLSPLSPALKPQTPAPAPRPRDPPPASLLRRLARRRRRRGRRRQTPAPPGGAWRP